MDADTDTFSHTGSGGTNPGQRMATAGYLFRFRLDSGAKISRGRVQPAPLTPMPMFSRLHKNLFLSAGHRTNTMKEAFKEIGVGATEGRFGSYNSLMVTQNFAYVRARCLCDRRCL